MLTVYTLCSLVIGYSLCNLNEPGSILSMRQASNFKMDDDYAFTKCLAILICVGWSCFADTFSLFDRDGYIKLWSVTTDRTNIELTQSLKVRKHAREIEKGRGRKSESICTEGRGRGETKNVFECSFEVFTNK